jgi:hypothetical protein
MHASYRFVHQECANNGSIRVTPAYQLGYNPLVDDDALAEMLERDRAEWRQLAALLDAQPGTPVHGPGSPAWDARDVYAHFARWLGHSTDDFEATLAGRGLPRPEGTDDEINARWRQEDAALSFDDASGRAQRAFDRRIEVLQSTQADRWNPLLDAIANADGYEHMAAHRRYIESSGA